MTQEETSSQSSKGPMQPKGPLQLSREPSQSKPAPRAPASLLAEIRASGV